MPQPRRGRTKAEPEEPEDQVEEEPTEEEQVEEEPEEEQQAELNVRLRPDVVEIDLPRDGNERKALEALASMLEALG